MNRFHGFDREGQFILPFAEKEYVTVQRTANILGVSEPTVYRLAGLRGRDGRELLTLVSYRRQARVRVLYSSIVRFCDGLRVKYGIPDRRPTLDAPWFRHKDLDLLPFPLPDTMDSAEAIAALGYADIRPLTCLIEEGRFEAYKLMEANRCGWRISRPMFRDFLNLTRDRDKVGLTEIIRH
jgi:hypothetical protein